MYGKSCLGKVIESLPETHIFSFLNLGTKLFDPTVLIWKIWGLRHFVAKIWKWLNQSLWKRFLKTSIYAISYKKLNIGYIRNTGCPKKHGNSVTNSISSLLWISIEIPNFKSNKIIMSAREIMKTVKDYKDVSIMFPQDKQWIRTSLLCLYTAIFLFY